MIPASRSTLIEELLEQTILSSTKLIFGIGFTLKVITFENTQGTLKGEAILKENRINTVIMPTPTYVTKSCGISLKIREEEIDRVKVLIKENKFNTKGIYFRDTLGYKIIEL